MKISDDKVNLFEMESDLRKYLKEMQISIVEEDSHVENWKSIRDYDSKSNLWHLRGSKRNTKKIKRTTMVTPETDKNVEIK